MSRTVKGKKADGFEYWSRRPGGACIGPFAKKMTHHRERQKAKREAEHEAR